MKKILTILSMVVILIGFTNCTSSSTKKESEAKSEAKTEAKTKLKKELAEANKYCPIDLGMMGVMTSLEYDEQTNEVKAKCLLRDEAFPIELFETEDAKDLMKVSLNDETMKANVNLMIEAGAGFVLEFKGSLTGKCVKTKFSLDDLKEVKNNPMSEDDMNREMLKLSLASTNSVLPEDLGNGLIMERVYDGGDNIVYVYIVEEAGGISQKHLQI